MEKGEPGPGFGVFRGGLSTKIHILADAQGRPLRFAIAGGQKTDAPQAILLLTGIKTGCVIADKGNVSNKILAFIRFGGAVAVILPKANRKESCETDPELYRKRNLIERAFNKLQHWRQLATRYERKTIYFLSALHLAAPVIWGR